MRGSAIVRRVDDLVGFAAFHALQREYEESLTPDLRHALSDVAHMPEVYAEPNAAFVALADAETAGCVAARGLDASTLVLQRLYVPPACRGLGIAHALVGAVIAHARTRAYRRVVLDTDRERLAPAYRLYRALGFTECAQYAPVDYASPTFMELLLSSTSAE